MDADIDALTLADSDRRDLLSRLRRDRVRKRNHVVLSCLAGEDPYYRMKTHCLVQRSAHDGQALVVGDRPLRVTVIGDLMASSTYFLSDARLPFEVLSELPEPKG